MQPAVPALSLAEARRLRQVQKQHQTQAIASALSTQSSDAQRKHQRECCFDDESDDEEQRQHEQRKREDHFDVDPDMKKAIENFAGLVAKNPAVQAVAEAKGRNDPKFRFLFDHDSPEFIYYKIQLDKCRQTLPPPEAGTVPALDAPPTDLRRQLPHLFQNPQVSDDGASTDSLSKMKEVLEAQKARAALEIPQEEKEARQGLRNDLLCCHPWNRKTFGDGAKASNSESSSRSFGIFEMLLLTDCALQKRHMVII